MVSATPKKFKSNVLAALDFKPDPDDSEDHNPLLTQTKRKQTPGSPDPRQPKRAPASIQPNIPGLGNVLCRCFGVINLAWDPISLSFSLRNIAATAINGRPTE